MTTLAQTVSNWRYELATAVRTGASNAKSEGHNRIVKLIARIAFGFRNPLNQRRRVRYAATRAGRHPPPHLATNRPPPEITPPTHPPTCYEPPQLQPPPTPAVRSNRHNNVPQQ